MKIISQGLKLHTIPSLSYFRPYLLLLFAFLLFTRESFCQRRKVDSLRQILPQIRNDSERIKTLYLIGLAQEKMDYKVSRKIFDTVALWSQKANYTLGEANAYLEIAGLGFDHADYESAIRYYSRASEKYGLLKGNDRVYGLAAVYNNLGGILSLINDWENAQKYYFRALKEYEKLQDSTKMITIYFNLAFLFSDMDEWGRSFVEMQKAFQFIPGSANPSQNLEVTSRLATIAFKIYRTKDGLDYLRLADSLLKYSSSDLDLNYYNHAYGEYYFHSARFDKAIEQHKLAYKHALLWDDPYYFGEELLGLGKDFLAINQFDSAGYYFHNAYDEALKHNYKPKVLLSLGYLSSLEEGRKNFQQAYAYKKQQALYADSLVKEQNHYRILLLDEEFGTEKRNNQIVQLQKDKQIQSLSLRQKTTLNSILFVSIAVLLLVGFLAYRNLRNRQQLAKQQHEIQQQRIRELEKDKQLVAVDSMLKGQEEERMRLAKDLHDGLGGMLSGVKFSLMNVKSNLIIDHDNVVMFERSLDMLDTSIQEIRRVAHNMMPEALVKFGLDEALKDFCDNINNSQIVKARYQSFGMNERLESNTEIIVYRIVQELLANIFKHAKATEVLVQLLREERRLSITVEDNGKGFDTAMLDQSKGAGWANIRSRVDYLKGKMDLSSTEGQGTSVSIELQL